MNSIDEYVLIPINAPNLRVRVIALHKGKEPGAFPLFTGYSPGTLRALNSDPSKQLSRATTILASSASFQNSRTKCRPCRRCSSLRAASRSRSKPSLTGTPLRQRTGARLTSRIA